MSAVPLVTVDDQGVFKVHDTGLNILSAVKGPIAIVAVAGLYRTGKSYLLNVLTGNVGSTSAFEVGHSVSACTKGMWLWSEPKYDAERDCHIFFVDTEGLGSTSRSSTHDSRVFALSLLLSSFFIYNSRGVIDGQAIEDLSLVANLTKVIHVRSGHTEAGSGVDSLADFFPSFLWVVRDFTLRLEDAEGRRISSTQYLENCLAPQAGFSEVTASKNELRQLIRQYFRERACLTMVRPAEDEAVLRSLAATPLADLRPEFQRQVTALLDRVQAGVRPKQMMGRTLDGAMLSVLLGSYVEALNSGGAPVISSAWERVVFTRCQEARVVALTAYDKLLRDSLLSSSASACVSRDQSPSPSPSPSWAPVDSAKGKAGDEEEDEVAEVARAPAGVVGGGGTSLYPVDDSCLAACHETAKRGAKGAFWAHVALGGGASGADNDDPVSAKHAATLKCVLRDRLEQAQKANAAAGLARAHSQVEAFFNEHGLRGSALLELRSFLKPQAQGRLELLSDPGYYDPDAIAIANANANANANAKYTKNEAQISTPAIETDIKTDASEVNETEVSSGSDAYALGLLDACKLGQVLESYLSAVECDLAPNGRITVSCGRDAEDQSIAAPLLARALRDRCLEDLCAWGGVAAELLRRSVEGISAAARARRQEQRLLSNQLGTEARLVAAREAQRRERELDVKKSGDAEVVRHKQRADALKDEQVRLVARAEAGQAEHEMRVDKLRKRLRALTGQLESVQSAVADERAVLAVEERAWVRCQEQKLEKQRKSTNGQVEVEVEVEDEGVRKESKEKTDLAAAVAAAIRRGWTRGAREEEAGDGDEKEREENENENENAKERKCAWADELSACKARNTESLASLRADLGAEQAVLAAAAEEEIAVLQAAQAREFYGLQAQLLYYTELYKRERAAEDAFYNPAQTPAKASGDARSPRVPWRQSPMRRLSMRNRRTEENERTESLKGTESFERTESS
jgi:hypothetical protein